MIDKSLSTEHRIDQLVGLTQGCEIQGDRIPLPLDLNKLNIVHIYGLKWS